MIYETKPLFSIQTETFEGDNVANITVLKERILIMLSII